jgi:hypothetical protein
MAGAGYKLFATGDVLTAAQVNTYLNEQTVMVFADSAARTTALSGVLAEGMMSYLQDTNAVEVYNGTAWVGVSGAGDVTEVQAGTGISVASGTGPIPVVTNSMATEIDAKGDLVVGTGADTFARLAVGTNGHTLVADSVETTGLKWVAPAGGAFVGCAAFRSSGTQSIPTGTTTALTLPSEEYDSDAFHDTSTNTSRFTIPAGKGGKYLVNAFVQGALNFGSLQQLIFLVNGSVYSSNGYNGGVFADQRYAADWVTGYSSVISLVAADYLEVALYHLAAGAVNAQNVRVSITYLGA